MILEVEGLDVYYGPVQALRNVSLHVEEGEMVSLLGANGAGKTTTLRTISGLLSPRSGSVKIGGREAGSLSAQKIVRLGVAHLPEGRELFPELTVTENLRLGHWSRRKERKAMAARLERMFELFPRLRERAGQQAGTMSGGEQQMLAVARALMSNPRLLLVDELSLGLAPIVVRQLFDAIAQVNREGTAVLLVEQFVHMALRHTARAYVLGKGEVVLEGASSDLLSSPDLMAAYLGVETGDGDGHATGDGSKAPAMGARAVRAARSPAAGEEAVSTPGDRPAPRGRKAGR